MRPMRVQMKTSCATALQNATRSISKPVSTPQRAISQAITSRTFSFAACRNARIESSSRLRCWSIVGNRLMSSPQMCNLSQRNFATSLRRSLKSTEEVKSRQNRGPFSWKAGLLFMVTGAGLVVYFQNEKARLERRRIAEQTKGIGKPRVGGSFDLVDHNGKPFTDDDMKGKYALVYFGFSHCPDICPEELDKMASMMDQVYTKVGKKIRPIFITCDPARDTPAVLKSYLGEFHPDFVGLTGSWDTIKATCKAYRVYFSTPPNVKPGQDYLVDHSIYFYLMDPEGDFVEALGRNFTAEQAAKIISDHVKDWRGRLDKS